MLSFSIIILMISLILLAFIFRHFQNSHQTHSEPITLASPTPSNDDFLEFDLEINKILNNPHLSEVEKERLTNEYAEQYLLKNQ